MRTPMLWLGLVASTPAMAAKPVLSVDPLDAMEALPAATAGTAWLEALEDTGVRISDDFERQVEGLHPFQTGRWSAPFYAEVVSFGGLVDVRGTVTVTAVGPAETRVNLRLDGTVGAPEVFAWNRLVKQTRAGARERLSERVTTPATVRSAVVAGLADPLQCVRHITVLRSSNAPGVVDMVVSVEPAVAATCQPAAIALLAEKADDPLLWAVWFRRAWKEASGGQRASLMGVLRNIPDRPADLELLVVEAAAEERERARAEEAAQRAYDLAPLQCADGSIDPDCTCGDAAQNRCCLYHGGVDRCLPPPPSR